VAPVARIAKLAEVAEHAGVSPATVSRALRNLPGVSQATRARVLSSARHVGYVMAPMPMTRSGGAACRVAVALPRVDTWFFGGVLGALSVRLEALGCLVEVHVLPDSATRNAFFANISGCGRLGGVVVLGMSLIEPERRALAALPAAVVGLHSAVAPMSSVDAEDERMARWAVGHLIGLGHRRIAMVSSAPGRPVTHVVPRARIAGYRAELAAAGIAMRPELTVCGDDTAIGGQEAAARLLVGRRPPTAVFVHSDDMAFGVLAALHAAGLSVPEDVSVVSIDDHALAAAFGLTTVAQNVEAQAVRAADLLVHAMASRPGGRPPELPPAPQPGARLIIRATTAPPRAPRKRRTRPLTGVGARPQEGSQR
jgi:LacI family repressor for deo operon, udp, cdd, tsx, nupC, and nupG